MSNLGAIKFFVTPPHDCSYLPDQQATTLFVDPDLTIDQNIYSDLSELGFRRSGSYVYRPHCEECNACIPIRVLTQEFDMRRRHRRIWKANRDLTITLLPPRYTDEIYQLYHRYISEKHRDGDMYPPNQEQFESFLLKNWSHTHFAEMRDKTGALIAVAVTDRLKNGLSAVYTFYDPSQDHRSLGTFSILWQIEYAKTQWLPHLFIGYWIKDCRKMNYKNQFKPMEMYLNHRWERISGKPTSPTD